MEKASVCRCCLSESCEQTHKDLRSPYVFLDRKEIYADMLLDCFNIVLLPIDMCTNSICDSCVKILRSSCSFKNQVQRSQEILSERMNVDRDVKHVEVKLEQKQDSDNDSDVCYLSDSDMKLMQIKLETKQDSDNDSDNYFLSDTVAEVSMGELKAENSKLIKKKHEQKKKKTKSKDKDRKSDRVKCLVNRLASSMNSCDIPTTLKKRAPKNSSIADPKELPKITWTNSIQMEKYKHMENLQNILKYSNVTPFKNKSLLGFICAYCDSAFPDPANLRIHTDVDHSEDRLNLKTQIDLTDYNVKLDVTDLTCNLCDEKCSNLYELKDHLVKTHKKTIHTDIKDLLLQYKLKKGDVYDCAMCTSTYETFKMLKQHMNIHYNNFPCSKCDSAFATRRSLNAHRTTHIEGSYKCEQCDKVFPSRNKMHYHIKIKHLGARNISNCPYCNEPFRSYYQRNQHLIKVHNAESQYKCNVCNRSFILKSLLMYHIKKNHLMERNAQCTECGFRFFSKKALKAHMVKHTGERNYACEICHKTYARKYTLREHMRIHNNDRRFKCDVCAMTFVQKCSLKSHLLSNHGISLAASEISSV